MEHYRPARRSLLGLGTAALVAGPALAGCARSATAARMTSEAPSRGRRVELVFWTWVPLQKAVDLWNRTHPGIHVEVQLVPQNTHGGYQKMYSSLRAGNPPDLAQVEYQELPAFMLVQGLTDLTAYGADALREHYVPWQWQQGVFGGRVYTIPQASGPMGMFYRKDLLDRWGIEAPATWQEYEAAARAVRRRGAYMCAFPPNQAGWLAAFAWQNGARWIRTDGDTWIVDIDSSASRQVAAYWDRMVRDDLVVVEPDMQSGWYKDLQDGRVVSWLGPQWGAAILRGNAPVTQGTWRVAMLPQWRAGRAASANWGGSSTAILQGSRHPTEALRFAHWLNTDPRSIDLLVPAGYGWPAARNAFQGSALDEPDPFFGGQRYNTVFAESDKNVDNSWKWPPTTDALFSHLTDALEAAAAGHGTFTGALADVQTRAVDDLLAKGLQARSAA
jgi:multiple sugar transport system substrate-binding protein